MTEALLLITWFVFVAVVCCTHETWRQPDLSRLKLLTNGSEVGHVDGEFGVSRTCFSFDFAGSGVGF